MSDLAVAQHVDTARGCIESTLCLMLSVIWRWWLKTLCPMWFPQQTILWSFPDWQLMWWLDQPIRTKFLFLFVCLFCFFSLKCEFMPENNNHFQFQACVPTGHFPHLGCSKKKRFTFHLLLHVIVSNTRHFQLYN